jgi:hypothetical protein
MFNINHFESFAQSNGLSLGPSTSNLTSSTGDASSASAPTKEPILYDDCTLPERGDFPHSALPPIISRYAHDLASVYQIPVELPALCMIAAISGSLGKSWEAVNATADRQTRGNFYTILSLPPGSGKSVANRVLKPMLKLQKEREDNWERDSAPKLQSEVEALDAEVRRLKNPGKNKAIDRSVLEEKICQLEEVKRKLKYSPSLTIGNATTSGLAAELARVDAETLFVFAPEGGEVVRVMLGVFRKDGTDMDLWLVGYTGESYKQTRAGGGNSPSISDACLSALLMVQPAVLKEVTTHKQARERGLLTRVFPVEINVDLQYDDGLERRVNLCAERDWDNLVERILRKRFDLLAPVSLHCPPTVREIFRDFHNQTAVEWASGPYADFRAELARWRENAIRLAVVLQIATDPESQEITETVARNAIALFRWIGIGALELFSCGREPKLNERRESLEKALRSHNGECLSSELLKRHGFEAAELKHLAAVFPEHFLIEEKPSTKMGGRPGKVVRLLTSRIKPPTSLN